jgi:hypothetical protein
MLLLWKYTSGFLFLFISLSSSFFLLYLNGSIRFRIEICPGCEKIMEQDYIEKNPGTDPYHILSQVPFCLPVFDGQLVYAVVNESHWHSRAGSFRLTLLSEASSAE